MRINPNKSIIKHIITTNFKTNHKDLITITVTTETITITITIITPKIMITMIIKVIKIIALTIIIIIISKMTKIEEIKEITKDNNKMSHNNLHMLEIDIKINNLNNLLKRQLIKTIITILETMKDDTTINKIATTIIIDKIIIKIILIKIRIIM